ncbi:tartrate dehydrogenase [Usnea florida]
MVPTKPVFNIASIPGDGIGSEVIGATSEVLQKLASTLGTFSLQIDHIPWSSEHYKAHGRYIPEGGLEELKEYDAILFGSVGDPDVPDHISLTGLRLTIIRHLHHYANLRPTRLLRGCTSPLAALAANASLLDWVIVRENSEGEYSGQGGRTHIGTPWEIATEVAIFTRHGVERIMKFAFETARERGRRKGKPAKLCVVTKSNAQIHGLVLWDEVAAMVSKEFPDVEWEKMLVDAMTVRMTLHPQTLDTIVATNLHADILSDLAAALAGSIGIAPTSNLDPTRGNPSMFEPIHGSAFEIVGKGIANPIGAIWTGAEMLRWLGKDDAADALMECVENVIASGCKTADLGGNARTEDVTNEICREIETVLGRPRGISEDR